MSEPEDDGIENPLESLVEQDQEPEIIGELPKEGWLVHVITKPIESETKSFGPFDSEEKALELQAMILGGVPVLTFVLLPSGVESVIVEPAGLKGN